MTTSTEAPVAMPPLFQEEFLNKPVTDWHRNSTAIFADHIQDVIYDRRKGPVSEVAEQFMVMFDHGLKSAPPAIAEAMRSEDGDPTIRAAYMLGCLGMAQQLMAMVASKRPDDAFYEAFKDPQSLQILDCLFARDTLKHDIPAKARLAQTTVDVRLKTMVGLGLVDYRILASDAGATRAYPQYFLTPAAKQMMTERAAQKPAA